MSDSAFATTKALSPVSASNGTWATGALVELLDVDAAAGASASWSGRGIRWNSSMAKYTSWSAGTPASKVTPLALARICPMPVLDEIQPLLFPQRGLEVARPADQTGLALLADAALETAA